MAQQPAYNAAFSWEKILEMSWANPKNQHMQQEVTVQTMRLLELDSVWHESSSRCRVGNTHKKPLANIFLLQHSLDKVDLVVPLTSPSSCRSSPATAADLSPGVGNTRRLHWAEKSQGSSASPADDETNEAGSVSRSDRSINLHQFSLSIQALLLVSLRL